MRPMWVFAGPSLPPQARPVLPDVEWRPPAIAGDGGEALQARPRAVVLIDGLFDAHPAIRHKELLALIEAGVPVVGGASMGALRAAELCAYGMIGAGRIFRAYASGRIEGDDEVAVLHGPAELDWAPLTVPQVNVRATLLRAVRDAVIPSAAARRIRARAGAIFFQDRTWRAVIAAARLHGDASPADLDRFAGWLGHGAVDLKRLDALECLAVATALTSAPAPRRGLNARTVFTEALAAQVASRPRLTSASPRRPPRTGPPPPAIGRACGGASSG